MHFCTGWEAIGDKWGLEPGISTVSLDSLCVRSLLWTHGWVDISKHVELNEAGENEEKGIAGQTDDTQTSVQLPPPKVDGSHLTDNIMITEHLSRALLTFNKCYP